MELYRTVVGTLEGVLWLLLLFALVIVVAVVFICQAYQPQAHPSEAKIEGR